MLCRWCVGVLGNRQFAYMLFVWCEEKFLYCRRLQNAIDASLALAEGDPKLKCWIFDKPYNNMYLVCGDTHKTRVLELEICEKTAGRNPIFVGRHNLKLFVFSSKDQFCLSVTVSTFWRKLKAHRILCVPFAPMFNYLFSVFGDNTPLFGHLLLKTAITELTIMLSV